MAPTSSTTLWPRLVGHRAAIAGRSMPSSVRSWNIDIAIKRAGVAGGDRDFGFFLFDGFDGAPHAGVAAAAQRLARLFFHAHAFGGVADLDARAEAWRVWRTAASAAASSPCRRYLTVGWRRTARASAATTTPGPASPPMASIDTVNSRVTSGL